MSTIIGDIASKVGISDSLLEPYGSEIAKIDTLNFPKSNKRGKLILVTALTPTKAGEGKTTTAIGLEEGFYKLGEKALLCLREPALGPVFGLKGGATGALKASLIPEEEINLHFTGDIHAITSAHNLIAAVLDNSLHFENPLNIDPEKIYWKRAMDMNERSLRDIKIGLGKGNGPERESGFIISVASELMAILCLASSREDFLNRLKEIVVAETKDGKLVTVEDLKVTHAVMRLMKHAFKPNLVRNSEGNPVILHGGPFANIAHGCSSVMASNLALSIAPYTITEAGFGSDLGAEKFLDILSQEASLIPDCVVLVASIRALKLHGLVPFEELNKENLEALEKGFKNLLVHYENLRKFGVNVVVAINRFPTDNIEEINKLSSLLKAHQMPFALSEGVLKGGEGTADLAKLVMEYCNKPFTYKPLYQRSMCLREKIEIISKEIYRASEVIFSPLSLEKLETFEKNGFKDAYICMAKTPMSLGDDPKNGTTTLSIPFHIRDVELAAGANFVIPLSGSVMRMPGLPKTPNAVLMEDQPWKL